MNSLLKYCNFVYIYRDHALTEARLCAQFICEWAVEWEASREKVLSEYAQIKIILDV